MDPTALRLEKIRLTAQSEEKIADVHARWYIATTVVALTIGGTALLAALAGQFQPRIAAAVEVLLAAIVAMQLRGLRQIGHWLQRSHEAAVEDVDRLIVEEGEPDGDGKNPDEGRT